MGAVNPFLVSSFEEPRMRHPSICFTISAYTPTRSSRGQGNALAS